MKYLVLFILCIGMVACTSTEEDVAKKPKEEQLVEIKDGIYTEWYPGKKQIKYRGAQDASNRRDGKWMFYSETGLELSFTMYKNGLKEGFTVVKYPNGVLRYRGEYMNDQMVGVWTTYDEKGEVATEKDYGYPIK